MRLPNGYAEVQYIQSSGTQYVDTGIKVNKADAYKMMLIAHLTSNDNYAGCNGYMQFQANIGNGQKSEITINYANITEKIFVDGVQVSSTNWASYNGQDVKLGLFKMGDINDGWFSGSSQIGKLYSCQIYSSTVLIRNYIPCINPDGEAGLYDTVNSKFYGNAGTGVFFAGPRRVKFPNGYKQLEYIQSSGTQYVDTNVKPTQAFLLDIFIQTLQTTSGGIAVSDQTLGTNGFGVWCNAAAFGSQTKQSLSLHNDAPIVIKLSQSGLFLNGSSIWTVNSETFTVPANMYLFALNRNGVISEKLTGKLYSCKLYDNATLIRDFVPCSNPLGDIGLYDLVNSKFYTNAGTGVFIAGPEVTWPSNDAIYVKVNGIWKQIDGIKIL